MYKNQNKRVYYCQLSSELVLGPHWYDSSCKSSIPNTDTNCHLCRKEGLGVGNASNTAAPSIHMSVLSCLWTNGKHVRPVLHRMMGRKDSQTLPEAHSWSCSSSLIEERAKWHSQRNGIEQICLDSLSLLRLWVQVPVLWAVQEQENDAYRSDSMIWTFTIRFY